MSNTQKDAADRDSSATRTEPRGEAKREEASKDAEAGVAPEQSDQPTEGMKQGGTHRDPPATYEPEKKRSARTTL